MNTISSTIGPNLKIFFYWGIGALALIALAEYQPQLAIMFVVILIFGVLLTHWSQYSSLLTPPKGA